MDPAAVRAAVRGVGRAGIHRARPGRTPVRPSGGGADADHVGHRRADREAYHMAMGTRVIEARTRAAGWLFAGALMLCCAGAAPAAAQSNPLYGPMIAAAQTMQAASRVLYAEKEARGLLPPSGTDPNRTGMIGLEYTTMTTTPGELPAKRTAASPDFAAAMVKLIGGLNLAPGAPVVTVLSGSYVGGDVAVL